MNRVKSKNGRSKQTRKGNSNLLLRTTCVHVPIDYYVMPDLMCMTPLTSRNVFNQLDRKKNMKVAVLGAEQVGKTSMINR